MLGWVELDGGGVALVVTRKSVDYGLSSVIDVIFCYRIGGINFKIVDFGDFVAYLDAGFGGGRIS